MKPKSRRSQEEVKPKSRRKAQVKKKSPSQEEKPKSRRKAQVKPKSRRSPGYISEDCATVKRPADPDSMYQFARSARQAWSTALPSAVKGVNMTGYLGETGERGRKKERKKERKKPQMSEHIHVPRVAYRTARQCRTG